MNQSLTASALGLHYLQTKEDAFLLKNRPALFPGMLQKSQVFFLSIIPKPIDFAVK